jgi:hypothetical protein
MRQRDDSSDPPTEGSMTKAQGRDQVQGAAL